MAKTYIYALACLFPGLIYLSSANVVSCWDFNELSTNIIRDKTGSTDLYLRYDNLANTFHENKYVTGLKPVNAKEHPQHKGNCLYICNLKPEHSVYPEHAYVEISRPKTLDFGKNSFTITGWFKKDRITAGHEAIIFNLSDLGGLAILITRADRSYAGKLLFEVKGSEPVSVFSNDRLDDNRWHWFGAVSDNGKMSLVVDGILQSQTSTYKEGTTTALSGGTKSRIGDGYNGCIDDISIYNKALNKNDLDSIYNGGINKLSKVSPDRPIELKRHEENDSGITISEKILFDGWQGREFNGQVCRLACGAAITEMPNGDLVAWCLTGSDNEPAQDNCVLITRSTDGGQNWSQPEIFISSADKMMVGLNCMYPLSDGRTVAIWSYLPWEAKYTQWLAHRMYSDDSGKTWSQPERFPVGNDNAAIGRPIKLANGEYLFTATIMDKRKVPLVAPVSELLKAKTEAQAAAMPAGEGRTAGEFGEYLWGCGAFISKNEDGSDLVTGGKVSNRPLGLLEPACVQLKDGRIVMLMRAQFAKTHLWRTESFDNGRTWLDAWETDIPNPVSMPFMIRLADGRIALLNNNSKTIREPLSIWISNDEMESWYIKENVLYGGMLAYPYGLVLKDGRFVFVYDHNRRQMRFVEVHFN